MSSVENNIMINLQYMNIIQNENTITYITPNKTHKLVIEVKQNTIWNNIPNQSQELITLSIFTLDNQFVYKFNYSELDAMRIIDSIYQFDSDVGFWEYQSKFFIELPSLRPIEEVLYLELQRDNIPEYIESYVGDNAIGNPEIKLDSQTEFYYDRTNDTIRDISLKLKSKRKTYLNYQQIGKDIETTIVNIRLSEDELTDFCDFIFYGGLINLDENKLKSDYSNLYHKEFGIY